MTQHFEKTSLPAGVRLTVIKGREVNQSRLSLSVCFISLNISVHPN